MNANQEFNKDCPGSLFWKGSLLQLLQSQTGELIAEVDSYNRDFILNCEVESVAVSLSEKYLIEPISLHRDRVEIAEHGQTTLEQQKRTCLVARDPRISNSVAQYYRFAVPFEGDARLFMRRPSQFEMDLPWGEVVGNELQVTCKTNSQDRDFIRTYIDDNLNRVCRWLQSANSEVEPYNARLKGIAVERLQDRRKRFIREGDLAHSLGFPIRTRSGVPETFQIPVKPKTLRPATPKTPSKDAVRESFIGLEDYDGILKTIASMARVMELNPKAFAGMSEESLRFMLLVPLNIHYEGRATGETFNYEGKTDIIIKVEGRNIFIAECLVWDGGEYFKSKIDQLLSYTSWRDTKTAIIIFNRNRNLSGVLSQIPALAKTHPNWNRDVPNRSCETSFRFVFNHRDDKDRELTLTVMVFDVPGKVTSGVEI